jgi:deoxyribose-phosphate aldolase
VNPQQVDQIVETLVTRVRQELGRRRVDAGAGGTGAAGNPRSEEALFQWQYAAGWDANVTLVPTGAILAAGRSDSRVARMIDHTLLKPEATREEVVRLCEEAKRHAFYSVCLNSSNIALASKLLAGSQTIPICVVGFPLGACLPQVKAFEAQEAIRLGAREIDMVINIGALKSGDLQTVHEDVATVVEASKPWPLKVILETSKLNDEEKVAACVISKQARAAFVKTSTGFGGGGATVEDVKLMKKVVGGSGVLVKASGGVRTAEDAWKMIEAGADRLGASSSVAIVTGGEGKGAY